MFILNLVKIEYLLQSLQGKHAHVSLILSLIKGGILVARNYSHLLLPYVVLLKK
jgi:hypothetical protein